MHRDEQVRRFVDGELSASERRALLEQAEHDLVLSTALLRAQELRAELMHLREATEVPATSSAQVQRIMQRALAARQAHEASPWRWLRTLWLPRFRVSVGGVLLASLAVALGTLAAALSGPAPSSPIAASAARGEPRVEPVIGAASAVAVHTPVAVRFMLPAIGAKSVSVVGDFNAWQAEATHLDDTDGDGVFVTTLLLSRGSYAYMFVIDGERWTLDPYATNFRDDGFGQRNAVVRVN